jgi:TolB-like protein
VNILEELNRRNVFKVAFAYLVVGWVVLQVAEFISPLLRLPEWTVSFALYIGIIGFPFALLFAWAFELTPDGLKPTRDVQPEESVTHKTGANLNRLITGLMALAVLILLVDRFLPQGQNIEEQAAPDTTVTAADKPKSIAVLPFVNMSDDSQQEYFSDGISEELLNALAKIRNLRVAARTSSFAFKGKNQDITNIGQQLNVETILEGSVRKSGQRIRITAQLINVNDGYHLWSETYDRDLTDIFAIQDEISAAIVAALKVHLTGEESTTGKREIDLDAYNFFLLARHSLRRRTQSSLQLAVKQYQQAISIDPTYAEAWAGKALATRLLSETDYGTVPEADASRQAQTMLDMAFALNPDLGAAHATQGLLYWGENKLEAALRSLNRAIELIPNEGILHSWKFNTYTDMGNYNAGIVALEQAYKIDPLHQTIRHNLVLQLANTGQLARAREMVTAGSALASELDANVAIIQGHYADAVTGFSKGIELSEGGADNSMELQRRLTYFYNLKNTELALPGARKDELHLYRSELDPAEFVRSYQPMLEQERLISLVAHIKALVRSNNCEQALHRLADKDFANAEVAIYGRMDEGVSHVDLAVNYAYCLQVLGRSEEARQLAQRVDAYIAQAVTNGEPPDYFCLLARVQMLLGENDGAMGSLRLAWQNYSLDWTDLLYPELAPLRSRPEYVELRESMQLHLNSERAKLGWEPVEL